MVGAGFFANVAPSFALASTLSIFLKSLTADLEVSRGVFSLLRSGEALIGAGAAPFVGRMVDRHGGKWLLVIGAVVVGIGYLLLGQVHTFLQFAFIRLSFVTLGDAMMGSMVVNIVLAHWFLRWRGRAMALSSMGIGFAKVCMPVVAAALIVWLGWRQTWVVFAFAAVVLGVVPVLLFIRRSPEEMGLFPDGTDGRVLDSAATLGQNKRAAAQFGDQEQIWTRGEVLRTSTCWLRAGFDPGLPQNLKPG